MFVRGGEPFNYDAALASDEGGLCCGDLSLAKQSFAEESDINTIVKRFKLTGEIPGDFAVPQYGDFTGVVDFTSAMQVVARARESFDSLPGSVRARFHNEPQELLEFCANEKNRPEAEKLGLVVPKVVVKPVEVAPGAAPAGPLPPPKGVVTS